MSGKKVRALASPTRMAPPQSPIPPGERPPVQTQEEKDAWSRYFAEHEKYLASLFSLEDLQDIVRAVGAPPLADTFNAQAIVRAVAGEIANRNLPANPVIEHTQRQVKQRKKEWGAIRKYIEKSASRQRSERQWLTERPWYGADAIAFRDDYARRLDTFAKAMDELEPWLFISRKTRGQHGGMGIKNPAGAVDIFVRLTWAWEEAGVTSPITKSKRYTIVAHCLKEIGEETFTEEALGRAIEKHLRAHPYHAQRSDGNGS